MEIKDRKNENYYNQNCGVGAKYNADFKNKNYPNKKNKKKENFTNNNPEEFYQNRDFKYKNEYGNNTIIKNQNHVSKITPNFQKIKNNLEVSNITQLNTEKESQMNLVLTNSNNSNNPNNSSFINQQPVNQQRMPFVPNNNNTNNLNNNGYFQKNKKMNYKSYNNNGSSDFTKNNINFSI